jgi:hypothetical protein
MEKYMQNLVDEIQKEFPEVILEQVFSGYITEIEDSSVFVELHDETHGIEDLSAEMDLVSFPKDPLYPQLKPGHIFYWYLGFEGSDDKPFSLIRFSQEKWTQEMLETAKEKAENLIKHFGISNTLDE